jgi:hypothetical protein
MLQPQKISTFVENKHYVKKKIYKIMEKLDLLVCNLSNANFEFNIYIIV